MHAKAAALLLMVWMPGGCQSVSSAAYNEVFSSLPFDEYSCQELAALRDQEAGRFNLPRNATLDQSWAEGIQKYPPLGSLLPDMRSKAEREAGIARGKISAMNRSLRRRGCEGALEAEGIR